jgi:hypothetical protein
MKKILIILFTIFTLQFFISPVTAETKVIPSFEKLVKEGVKTIELDSVFNACIDKIEFGEEDLLTGEKKIGTIWIKGAKYAGEYTFGILYVSNWEGLSSKASNIPSANECYNFQVEGPLPTEKDRLSGIYIGYDIKIASGEFEINRDVVEPKYKKKMTVTEFLEDGLDYGSRIVEITGKIYETDYNSSWFKIELFSEKIAVNWQEDLLHGFYYPERWKNDEVIKDKLRSLKVGQTLTLRGQFKGPNTYLPWQFEVFEIID